MPSPVKILVTNKLVIPTAGIEESIDLLKGKCTHSNKNYFMSCRRMIQSMRANGRYWKMIDQHIHRYGGSKDDAKKEIDRKCISWVKEPSHYITWKEENGNLILPRGCTSKVREALIEINRFDFEFVDRRFEGDFGYFGYRKGDRLIPAHKVTPWAHQADIVEVCEDIEQGLVRSPTGSGKTTSAIALIAAIQTPTIVIVWSTKLLDQWVERIVDELGVAESSIGILGKCKERYSPITVAMQQTLAKSPAKLKKCARIFGAVCGDEVQRFAANTFTSVIEEFPAKYRIGFSADERRGDGKHPLINDSFGRVLIDIKRKDLEDKELVMPVRVIVVPTKFKAEWYLEQQENDNVATDFTRLIEEITNDSQRNDHISKIVERYHQDCSLLLTHRREHALEFQTYMTRQGYSCGLMLGGTSNEQDFERSISRIRKKLDDMAIGTYQAIGVGTDIKPVDCGFCLTPVVSQTAKQNFNQIRGRICRKSKGKKRADLIYFWDQHVFGVSPLKNLRNWNDGNVLVDNGDRLIPVNDFLKGLPK